MQQYGIRFYTDLAKRCEEDIGFCASGIAYIHQRAEAWEEAQSLIESARRLGTRLEVLTLERAAQLLPEIRFEAVAGIAFDPEAIRLRREGQGRPGEAAQAGRQRAGHERRQLRQSRGGEIVSLLQEFHVGSG